ncbi:MAG: LytR/AlgR family response regulator transcription factor [Cytophagales bacterium]
MLTCLLIEDEPLAADVLQDYISQVPFLTLAGSCPDALSALEFLRTTTVDVLFLDIHLPGLKGLDFLRTLKTPPAVILTTAYHQYAVESYELNVVDYLLKPIGFKRFLEAVNKIKAQAPRTGKVISIHADRKTVLLPIEEILFVESQKEYIRIQTTSGVHVTKYPLSKFEEDLRTSNFLRVHRSFIVGLRHVKAFNLQEVDVPGKSIPIGANYQEHVSNRLRENFKQE